LATDFYKDIIEIVVEKMRAEFINESKTPSENVQSQIVL